MWTRIVAEWSHGCNSLNMNIRISCVMLFGSSIKNQSQENVYKGLKQGL